MDAVFYFSFYEPDIGDNKPVARDLGFCVGHLTRPWPEITRGVYECEDQLGRIYGRHNWLVGATGEINVFEYESYEVKACHHDELMELWRRDFLRMNPGCVVGEVFTLDLTGRRTTPSKIFQYAKDTHEQQQLRATLNAHITTPASSTVLKKM